MNRYFINGAEVDFDNVKSVKVYEENIDDPSFFRLQYKPTSRPKVEITFRRTLVTFEFYIIQASIGEGDTPSSYKYYVNISEIDYGTYSNALIEEIAASGYFAESSRRP